MKINLAIDSGAHSIHTRKHKSKDFSLESYMKDYVRWCKEHGDEVEFYVSLDIIHDEQKTWDNTARMRKSKLLPMPVLHFGAKPEGIDRYLDDHEYLGLSIGGGIPPTDEYAFWVSKVMKRIGKEHKVHGFASTAYSLISLPWYSVDSTTPWGASRNGMVLIPQPIMKGGKATGWMFDKRPYMLSVSTGNLESTRHITKEGPTSLSMVLKYLDELGFKLEDVQRHYHVRDVVNMWYMHKMYEGKGVKYFVSGRTGTQIKNIPAVMWELNKLGMKELNYLGTFFDLDPFHIMQRIQKEGIPKKRPPVQVSQTRESNQVQAKGFFANEHSGTSEGVEAGKPSPSHPRLHPRADPPVLQRRPRLRV